MKKLRDTCSKGLEDVFGSISKPFSTGEFEWSINECSNEILDTNRYLNSPPFSFSGGSWYARMYPNGIILRYKEFVSLVLFKMPSESEKKIAFSVAMKFEDKQCFRKTYTQTFKKPEEAIGWGKFVLRKDILPDLSTETIGRLCIKIRVKQNVPSKEDILLEVIKQDTMMCQNFKDLLLHDKERDLILKVKNKDFEVHQNIMQFRCPVFKLMFAHDMLERNRSVVEIPDCDPLAFEQFLLYIYTGNVETLDESIMLSLYYIADKYDMRNLQKMCCEFIKVSLSACNIFEVIRLAIFHSDSSLLESANIYFVNNAPHVLPTTEWLSFMNENPIVANELMIKTVSHYKPKGNKTET